MSVPTTVVSAVAVAWPRLSDYLQLTKPRLSLMVLMTVAVAFFLAAPPEPQLTVLASVLLGMLLVVGGANALNQYAERDTDARMRRTKDRPLPDGRLAPKEALFFGLLTSCVGILWLYLSVNGVAGLLATVSTLIYVLAYTPLKRRTPLCTLVGALPGAAPPLVGWAAATGALDAAAWSLFAIIFIWQMPHFLAISRRYREDYARAGLPMLAVQDPDGSITGRISLACALILVPVSLVPTALGVVGMLYVFGGLVLGSGFLAIIAWSLWRGSEDSDRWVFRASLLYLTGLLILMLLDRQPFI